LAASLVLIESRASPRRLVRGAQFNDVTQLLQRGDLPFPECGPNWHPFLQRSKLSYFFTALGIARLGFFPFKFVPLIPRPDNLHVAAPQIDQDVAGMRLVWLCGDEAVDGSLYVDASGPGPHVNLAIEAYAVAAG